jgi:S1-C subfamily serine protease
MERFDSLSTGRASRRAATHPNGRKAWAAAASFLLAAALQALPAPAGAQQPTQEAPASLAKTMAQTVNAVVGLRSKVPAQARSADTLGREREGSGILIDREGHVLTIGYLLLEASEVTLTTDDGLKVPASVVAYDQASGLGMVRAAAPLKIEPALLGQSAKVAQDEPVLTVSGGENGGIAAAQVVSRRSFAGYWEYLLDDAIFTMPARSDHSGAALVNAAGELIGVGSLFVQDAAAPQRYSPGNMFVPIDLFKSILGELKTQGESRASKRPWLGVSAQEQDGRLRVVRVTRDSPAARAGIQAGDLLLAINGEKIDSLSGFYLQLWKAPSPEVEVELTLLKGAELTKLRVRAGSRQQFLVKDGGI